MKRARLPENVPMACPYCRGVVRLATNGRTVSHDPIVCDAFAGTPARNIVTLILYGRN